MAKATRPKRNLTQKQLANLKGVQNAKPKKNSVDKLTPDEKRRKDWELNNEHIHYTYTTLFLKNQKPPTITEVAEAVKMSWRHVANHMENYDFDGLKQKFLMGNPAVYGNMFKQAATSKNPKWAELWLKWSGDLQDKVDITSGGKPLPAAPPPLQGVIKIDPKTLPTKYLEKLIAEHESNNS